MLRGWKLFFLSLWFVAEGKKSQEPGLITGIWNGAVLWDGALRLWDMMPGIFLQIVSGLNWTEGHWTGTQQFGELLIMEKKPYMFGGQKHFDSTRENINFVT